MIDLRFESSARRCGCAEPIFEPSPRASGGWPARGVLFNASTFQLGYTRCRPVNDGIGPENQSGVNVLAFPRRGVFVMHMPGETFVADPNIVIFQNADDIFRTSHPGGQGDDTTWVAISPELVVETMREFDPGVADRPMHPFATSHAPSSPRTFLLQRLAFEHAARGRQADALLVAEAVHELVTEAISTSNAAAARKPVHMRSSTMKVHIETSEAVKSLLARRFSERLTLDEIAAHVHAAPCHLCRLFRRVVGLPIHRYLNRLRLREAITRFADPSANLAGVAIDVGFASHSHFTDAFRREFGVPPSQVRQWMVQADLSEVIRIPQNNRAPFGACSLREPESMPCS